MWYVVTKLLVSFKAKVHCRLILFPRLRPLQYYVCMMRPCNGKTPLCDDDDENDEKVDALWIMVEGRRVGL